MYYVYILLCSDGSFYTGSSNNPHQRFLDHKNGKGGAYTRSHKPIKLIYMEELIDKSSALKREIQIKGWSHRKKIKILNWRQTKSNLPPLFYLKLRQGQEHKNALELV